MKIQFKYHCLGEPGEHKVIAEYIPKEGLTRCFDFTAQRACVIHKCLGAHTEKDLVKCIKVACKRGNYTEIPIKDVSDLIWQEET